MLVVVTGTEILVGGRVVASVTDALNVDGDLIQPLKAELDVEASREVIRKENEADSKRVTIMGDKDIPYRLLRKVMFTGGARRLQRRLVRGAPEVRAVRAARMSEPAGCP